jgi:fumarate reductase subunit D
MKAKKEHLTGMPAILAVVLGVLCPLCFIAPLLITAGLGTTLALFVPWFKPLLIISLIITALAFALSFRVHKNLLPLVLATVGGGLMYYGGYIRFEQNLIYLGGILLIASVSLDWWFRRQVRNCLACRVNPEHHKAV